MFNLCKNIYLKNKSKYNIMVVKKKGGNKQKKKKNNLSDEIERELIFKTDDQEYAQVTKLLGSCRLELQCFDGKTRLGHIRGTMRKKVWITVNDLVLISLREFEDGKCDIIHKYLPKELNKLKSVGEIPETVKVNEDTTDDKNDDIGFDFSEGEEEIDEIDIDAI